MSNHHRVIGFCLAGLVGLMAAGCGGNSTVDRAYDVYRDGGTYQEAASILNADTIDYESLSMKDFAKLGMTITFINASTIDNTEGIDIDRFEEISKEYDAAKSKLTPEQLAKLQEERSKLVK